MNDLPDEIWVRVRKDNSKLDNICTLKENRVVDSPFIEEELKDIINGKIKARVRGSEYTEIHDEEINDVKGYQIYWRIYTTDPKRFYLKKNIPRE